MAWSESEHDWISRAAFSNPNLRVVARNAIASSKFAISPVYRKFVINDLLTEDERAQLCKMVWDRFKVEISGSEAIFSSVLRDKLPSLLYVRFQEYMAKCGIKLRQKRIARARVYTVETPPISCRGKRFRWFCQQNQMLARDYNVDFCDVVFNRSYMILLDAYAQNSVDFDVVRRAFEAIVSGDYYLVTIITRDYDISKRSTLIPAWLNEGKIVRVDRTMYKVNCKVYEEAIKNGIQVSSESA